MRRYALYYAPRADEPLARFARSWLGRDPETGLDVGERSCGDLALKHLDEITADPRHYGFHGTLKPPFALADGFTEADFLSHAGGFASGRNMLRIERMALKTIGSFIALVPAYPSAELSDFAADCVCAFDGFRAAPSPEDLARRRASGLTPRQDELLVQWGYPYVFDEFRFHLTLTGSLDADRRSVVQRILSELTEPFCSEPLLMRDLVVFLQENRRAPFTIRARFPLVGA